MLCRNLLALLLATCIYSLTFGQESGGEVPVRSLAPSQVAAIAKGGVLKRTEGKRQLAALPSPSGSSGGPLNDAQLGEMLNSMGLEVKVEEWEYNGKKRQGYSVAARNYWIYVTLTSDEKALLATIGLAEDNEANAMTLEKVKSILFSSYFAHISYYAPSGNNKGIYVAEQDVLNSGLTPLVVRRTIDNVDSYANFISGKLQPPSAAK